MDKEQILAGLNFGRVDAETDDRFDSCFIGTEMLKQVLLPKHSLVLGSKGSGKSAAFRLLSEDQPKLRAYFPKGYKEILCIPVYGLQGEDFVPGMELRDLGSNSVDDFRYFWLLSMGLKTVTTIVQNETIQSIVEKSKNPGLVSAYKTLSQTLVDLGVSRKQGVVDKMKQRLGLLMRQTPSYVSDGAPELDKIFSGEFQLKTGMSTLSLLDHIDTVLKETNCLAWVLLDKLDLLFIDDFQKLRAAITGLIQLLVEYSSRFKHIQFKIFLRNDIYRQLHIVNKSHLVSYTCEMKWRDSLLLKLLVSRAIADPPTREYCEELLGEKIDIGEVIAGSDEKVLKLFYLIFEPSFNPNEGPDAIPFTHVWILKHLADGTGNIYPRELIHLGNLAVEKQREINRNARKDMSSRLISGSALKEAFASVSVYRCDTYLYSEFPHLSKHFDVFRGSDSATFTREELYRLFERLTPNGDEGIRSVHDAGLLQPLGRTVDSSLDFKVPLLYRVGLGMIQRKGKARLAQKLSGAQYLDSSELDVE
jgi:hypothetical protein